MLGLVWDSGSKLGNGKASGLDGELGCSQSKVGLEWESTGRQGEEWLLLVGAFFWRLSVDGIHECVSGERQTSALVWGNHKGETFNSAFNFSLDKELL